MELLFNTISNGGGICEISVPSVTKMHDYKTGCMNCLYFQDCGISLFFLMACFILFYYFNFVSCMSRNQKKSHGNVPHK